MEDVDDVFEDDDEDVVGVPGGMSSLRPGGPSIRKPVSGRGPERNAGAVRLRIYRRRCGRKHVVAYEHRRVRGVRYALQGHRTYAVI